MFDFFFSQWERKFKLRYPNKGSPHHLELGTQLLKSKAFSPTDINLLAKIYVTEGHRVLKDVIHQGYSLEYFLSNLLTLIEYRHKRTKIKITPAVLQAARQINETIRHREKVSGL